MTIEERFERIEHLTAGMAEERRKDREEYKALWRDTQRHIDELAVETRLRFNQVADQIASLADSIQQQGVSLRQYAAESREADKRLEARIESLVSAMGDFIARQRPQ